ncbi:MAG: hypothetical protein ACREJC_18955 [Tepidisphaeraceae bacterium]
MKTRSIGYEWWSFRRSIRWTVRKLKCVACGYDARHYAAQWDWACPGVFGIPYAGANGGIEREVAADEDFQLEMMRCDIAECEVYLSKCCAEPYRRARSTRTRRLSLIFGERANRCRAMTDDNVRCRLNAHPNERPHLADNETPHQRADRNWTRTYTVTPDERPSETLQPGQPVSDPWDFQDDDDDESPDGCGPSCAHLNNSPRGR